VIGGGRGACGSVCITTQKEEDRKEFRERRNEERSLGAVYKSLDVVKESGTFLVRAEGKDSRIYVSLLQRAPYLLRSPLVVLVGAKGRGNIDMREI